MTVKSQLYYDHHAGIERAIVVWGSERSCFFNALACPQQTGAVYAGKIIRRLKEGAFVDIGEASHAFLADSGTHEPGQTLLLQVKSEAREAKGVAVTTQLALPGIYWLYHPSGQGLHYARLLTQPQKQQLAARHAAFLAQGLPALGGGWRLRRAALHASPQALAEEATILHTLAAALTPAVTKGRLLPAPTAFEQAVFAAYALAEAPEIILAPQLDIRPYTGYLQAALPHLKLPLLRQAEAFEQGDLAGFYESLQQKTMPLPRGGSLIFEPLTTLCVVDVNGGDNPQPLAVNLTAAPLIMQQLRWRNLGGLILIDFLRMREASDREAVLKKLRQAAIADSQPLEIYGFTRMGLCELSRARKGYALGEVLTQA